MLLRFTRARAANSSGVIVSPGFGSSSLRRASAALMVCSASFPHQSRGNKLQSASQSRRPSPNTATSAQRYRRTAATPKRSWHGSQMRTSSMRCRGSFKMKVPSPSSNPMAAQFGRPAGASELVARGLRGFVERTYVHIPRITEELRLLPIKVPRRIVCVSAVSTGFHFRGHAVPPAGARAADRRARSGDRAAAGAPRRPSGFHCAFLSDMPSSPTPGSSSSLRIQSCDDDTVFATG
jgi:hypothetical protein